MSVRGTEKVKGVAAFSGLRGLGDFERFEDRVGLVVCSHVDDFILSAERMSTG
jgi:hypothetical protein